MNARFSKILIAHIILSVSIFIISLFLGLPLIQSFLIGILPWPFFLLFFSPISLLFTLLSIRPSLDRLSEILSFPLSFDPNRIVTVAQLFGLLTVFLGILYLLPRMRQIFKIPLFPAFALLLTWGTGTLLYSINLSQTLYELASFFHTLHIPPYVLGRQDRKEFLTPPYSFVYFPQLSPSSQPSINLFLTSDTSIVPFQYPASTAHLHIQIFLLSI